VLVPALTAPPRAPNGAHFAHIGDTMGTTWRVRGFATAPIAARLGADIEPMLDRIVREMSQWEPGADLSRFNALPAGESMRLPEAFAEVLACALEIAADSDGAFDPTLGALVDLWGFGPAPPAREIPLDAEIADALAAAGWRRLAFDTQSRTLTQPGGLKLDLAGIAKGYAVDCVARLLIDAGVHSFLVEIGGELRGAGVKPDAQPWWVEIERPPKVDTAPMLVALHEFSVATSGDYRRTGELNGARIAHTIDPSTGRPLTAPPASVTVLHASCMRADAYASALTIMGPEQGLAWAAERGLMAMFVLRGENGARELMSPLWSQLTEA
jgi:thiamine biosynthesis lipoprotein